MRLAPWSLIPLGTQLKDIAPCGLLLFTDDKAYLLTLEAKAYGKFVVADATRWPSLGRIGSLAPDARLRDYVSRVKKLDDPRFMLLPGVVSPRPSETWYLLSVVMALAAIAATVWLRDGWVFVIGALAALFGVPVVATVLSKPRVSGQERLGVTASNIHAYALAVERGELWRGALPAGAPVSPRLQVERIRQDYARLRSDLVYRLECPALFDPAVPTTAAFEAALVDFEDSPTSQAADVVEIRFQVARQHAERTGLRHVETAHRSQVARAVKIAKLATNSSSPEEQRVALMQLHKILDSLALYYVDRPEITK
ncbi:MAG: hypothetical protein Q4D96_01930 [Propionibacteriaceae bacterium]|nr:hypothetical protein [Propionibacteriaceae bacterium]